MSASLVAAAARQRATRGTARVACAADRPHAPAERRAIRRALRAWFTRHARDLPWRRTHDPYRVWLSEVMLQQTQVRTVVPYYERFLAAFPSVEVLAEAPEERVLKLWEGLGYYSRARNLRRAAKQLVERHAGRFPTTADAWKALPGVGRYTAAAIASIVSGERTAVLDGNVKRVLSRLCLVWARIDEKTTLDRLWELADELVDPEQPGDFNQAMMELGARVCTPRRPDCDACPLARWCRARAAGEAERLPVRSARRVVPAVELLTAAVRCRGRWLLARRPATGLLAGLWGWPSVEGGDLDGAGAMEVSLRERFGVRTRLGAMLGTIEHVFTHRRWVLRVYEGRTDGARRKPPSDADWRWVTSNEMQALPLARVDQKVWELVRERLGD